MRQCIFRRAVLPSLFCLSASLAPQAALAKPRICAPEKFGAKADGSSKDTAAIQAAVDACAEKGGIVLLSKGTYVSGPIVLKSNITLRIAAGATLLGSPDHADYPEILVFRAQGTQSLLSAANAHNITIDGAGTVDGNGASWWHRTDGAHPTGVVGQGVFRPRLVVFDHSRHIRMEGVTFQNSPSWQIVPYYSDDVILRNIRVLAPEHSPNTDAIDPFSSSNVVIDHVYADVGDDNIAIKSGVINSPGPDAPSKNIRITDCTFEHGHGLSIGSEIAGGAQNIHAERIRFNGTDQGVRIKANRDRGSDVSDIVFKDLEMTNVKTPILITEFYPGEPPVGDNPAQPVTRLTPLFHNIRIENLHATGGKTAGQIFGLPESPVKDLVLKNVTIAAASGMVISDADVTTDQLTVTAEQGEALTVRPSAHVTAK